MQAVQSVSILICNDEVLYSTNDCITIIIIIIIIAVVRLLTLKYSLSLTSSVLWSYATRNLVIVSSVTHILIPLNPPSVWFNIA
jgi:hypothetical protein